MSDKLRKPVIVAVTLFASLLAIGVIILFGNCQWSPYIYVFQAYWLKRGECGIILPPKNYTGKWVTYYNNGQPSADFEYINGQKKVRDFCQKSWYRNGELAAIDYWQKDGSSIGGAWHTNGYLMFAMGKIVNGKIDGCFKEWDDQGNLKRIRFYKNGVVIKDSKHPDKAENPMAPTSPSPAPQPGDKGAGKE